MPKPTPGEDKNAYVSRCIREVMDEGATHEQAVGKCMGMWRTYAGKEIEGEVFRDVPDSLDPGRTQEELRMPDDQAERLSERNLDDVQDAEKDLDALTSTDINVAWPHDPEEKIQARRDMEGSAGAGSMAVRPTMDEEMIAVGKAEEEEPEWDEVVLSSDDDIDPDVEKDMREGGERQMHETEERQTAEKATREMLNSTLDSLRDHTKDCMDKMAAVDEFNEDTVGDSVAHLGPVAGEIRRVIMAAPPAPQRKGPFMDDVPEPDMEKVD